ncbi:MAG: pilus assembly protein [Rhodobacteraceae bacterium]|nr:pilus assembly protein [Paracoccaceae bacterium]
MRRLKLHLLAFRDREEGNMVAEGVLAFIMLIWWYMASFTFFDALRLKNMNLKAAYTLADLVTREVKAVNKDYIKGLNTVFDYLTYSPMPTWVRVSSVEWDNTRKHNEVLWSCATGTGHQVYDNTSIQGVENRIPVMPEGDTIIIVETFMGYRPVFKVGLEPRWFSTFITTRPRSSSKIDFSGTC